MNNLRGRQNLWIDNPSYSAIHKWIVRNYGKANICSNNTLHVSKKYDWANISGKYKRDIDDWKQLCRSCHIKYDMNEKRKLQILNMTSISKKPIATISNDRNILNKYDYILLAAKILNLDSSGICKVLKGKRKTTGGYRFIYL